MPPEPAPGLRSVHMEAATDGLVLTLDIAHRYENASAEPIEVVYAFPIPFDAVILGVEAEIDGRALAVGVRKAGEAEEAYEGAQADRSFAALVERPAPGLCTASLGRLAPGGGVRLHVRLARFLDVAGGYARIVLPSVATQPQGSRRAAASGPLGPPTASLLADYPLTFRLTLVGTAAKAAATSPTHALRRTESEGRVVLTLAEAASLDRDVVVTLDGLPAEGGGWVAHPSGALAVAATTAPIADGRRPMNAVVLIDAAGPLGPRVRETFDLLTMLAGEREPGDWLAVARIGRTLSPIAPAPIGAEPFDVSMLGDGAADLGDIPPGAPSPPFELPPGADVCLVTDGRTRVAEAVAQRASAEERRLFVVGAGAAPDAGWLHPAALATGGDYVGLSPHEALELAAHRLLGALTLPPVARPPPRWSGSPIWSDGPAVWRSGLREIVCAAFEADPPETLTLSFEETGSVMRLPRLAEPDVLADAAARVAAARRLPALGGQAQADWARRFALPIPGAAWIAEAAGVTVGGTEARLVATPQMVAAGWRGVGRLSPVPAASDAPLPPPMRPQARPVGARKPSRLGIAAAALVAVAAAGLGVWAERRSPPAPAIASSERFPSPSVRTGSPLRQADAEAASSESPGVAAGTRVEPRALGPPIGWIAALVAAVIALAVWLRGRRRRRG